MSSLRKDTETLYTATAPATTNFAAATQAHLASADHVVVGHVSNEAPHQSGITFEI